MDQKSPLRLSFSPALLPFHLPLLSPSIVPLQTQPTICPLAPPSFSFRKPHQRWRGRGLAISFYAWQLQARELQVIHRCVDMVAINCLFMSIVQCVGYWRATFPCSLACSISCQASLEGNDCVWTISHMGRMSKSSGYVRACMTVYSCTYKREWIQACTLYG